MLRKLRRRLYPHWTDDWTDLLREAETKTVLHLGAGMKPMPGAIAVDINVNTKPTVAFDLNQTPWPFGANTFDGVVAISVLEHLDDFLSVMAEMHRVLKDEGTASILVPHFSSAASSVDPTHRQQLSARSCDYFIRGTALESEYGFYVPFRFDLVKRRVQLQGWLRYIPGVERLLARSPAWWEDHLCYVVRGSGIFWQLRAVK